MIIRLTDACLYVSSSLNELKLWINYKAKSGHIMVIHYSDVIMCSIASQITSLTIVYSSFYSGADQRKTSKLRVTGLCAGNSPETGEFPAQRASNAENVSIWWRHHAFERNSHSDWSSCHYTSSNVINSLAPGRCVNDFKSVISQDMLWIKFISNPCFHVNATGHLWWYVNIGSDNVR